MDIKTATGTDAGAEKQVPQQSNMASFVGETGVVSEGKILDGQMLEVCADINRVAELNMPDAEALQKLIVRRLDTWMLPQLWILYMLNYLNRTNIAQARLNTFDQDLGLVDGDYQVSLAAHKVFPGELSKV
jgi:hypothetical protein